MTTESETKDIQGHCDRIVLGFYFLLFFFFNLSLVPVSSF